MSEYTGSSVGQVWPPHCSHGMAWALPCASCNRPTPVPTNIPTNIPHNVLYDLAKTLDKLAESQERLAKVLDLLVDYDTGNLGHFAPCPYADSDEDIPLGEVGCRCSEIDDA